MNKSKIERSQRSRQKPKNTPKGEAFWRKVLRERDREEITFSEAARIHGVSTSRLSYWATRLGMRKELETAAQTKPVKFVEVSLPEVGSKGECFEARFPNGLTISVPTSAPVATAAELIETLMHSAMVSL